MFLDFVDTCVMGNNTPMAISIDPGCKENLINYFSASTFLPTEFWNPEPKDSNLVADSAPVTKKPKLGPSPTKVNYANFGTTAPIPIRIGNLHFAAAFTMAPRLFPICVLGRDFMDQEHAVLEYSAKGKVSLKIGDAHLKLARLSYVIEYAQYPNHYNPGPRGEYFGIA
jgi:hypothetical protein